MNLDDKITELLSPLKKNSNNQRIKKNNIWNNDDSVTNMIADNEPFISKPLN